MIQLDKANRDSYWWNNQGIILLDPAAVESVEQMFDRNAGGNLSEAYTLVTMRTGIQHKVFGGVDKIARQLGLISSDG